MSRSKIKTVRGRATAASWALIPIDGQPIRERARQEYQKVLRDLRRARADLERFEKKDKPGFNRWLHRQFGALLTELRETQQKLLSSRRLLLEIESEAFAANCSHLRAYEQVMWRRQHPEAEPPFEPGNPHTRGSPNSWGPDETDPFAGFKKFFSGSDDGSDQRFGAGPHGARLPANGEPAPRTASRLKELYRAVVRRLHPDRHTSLTAQQKEWWHQAQAAYRSGDFNQLEIILTLCEIEEQGGTTQTSVSLLQRITRQFKSTLRALKIQILGYRRDPAWNFSNLDDRESLLALTERRLRAQLAELRSALDVIDAQIGCWARQAQMAGRRPSRRPRVSPRSSGFY